MYNQNLKDNINKIDFNLKKSFDNISYDHNDDTRITHITLEKNNIKVIVNVSREELNRNINSVNWNYSINPNDIEATHINKNSVLENLGLDVLDIINNKRMDPEYIKESMAPLDGPKEVLIDKIYNSSTFEIEELQNMSMDELNELYNSLEIDEFEEELKREDNFQIGESITFTDYAYNEHNGTIEKKISMTIEDKVYPAWLVKNDKGEEKQVMEYDIKRPSGQPKWWNN